MMVQSMIADDFTTCYRCKGLSHRLARDLSNGYEALMKMKLERGLALQDLITGVLDFVQDVEYPVPTRVYLLDQLAAVE